MSLDAAILGFLGECPRTGYDLKTRGFDDAVSGLWTADQAQIYRTLERLQSTKLVRVTRKRQSGKPDRKIYSLTELGSSALTSWLDSGLELPAPREAFLLQLFFGAGLTDAELGERLAHRRALHQLRLDQLRGRAGKAAADESVSARRVALHDAAFDGAIATQRALIDWLDDVIESLAEGELPPLAGSDAEAPLLGPTTA